MDFVEIELRYSILRKNGKRKKPLKYENINEIFRKKH